MGFHGKYHIRAICISLSEWNDNDLLRVSNKVTQHTILEKLGLNYLLNKKITISNETKQLNKTYNSSFLNLQNKMSLFFRKTL